MDINLSKAQYSEMYKEASKGTKWWVTIPKAFLFGGLSQAPTAQDIAVPP